MKAGVWAGKAQTCAQGAKHFWAQVTLRRGLNSPDHTLSRPAAWHSSGQMHPLDCQIQRHKTLPT